MQAVWETLQTRYKGMVIAPCAAYCFNLLFGEITNASSVTPATVFATTHTQYWRNCSLPKSVLERYQLHECTAVRQLQRAGKNRWKAALLVGISLLGFQTAMQMAVVDDHFKNMVLLDKDKRGRDPAVDVVQPFKNVKTWADLQLHVNLLEPVANALDNDQGDMPGIGSVYAPFLRLLTYFQWFKYPATPAGAGLKAYCLLVLQQRRTYLVRPVNIFAYLLDPRHVDSSDMPTNAAIQDAMDFLVELEKAHDLRLAMRASGITTESQR